MQSTFGLSFFTLNELNCVLSVLELSLGGSEGFSKRLLLVSLVSRLELSYSFFRRSHFVFFLLDVNLHLGVVFAKLLDSVLKLVLLYNQLLKLVDKLLFTLI